MVKINSEPVSSPNMKGRRTFVNTSFVLNSHLQRPFPLYVGDFTVSLPQKKERHKWTSLQLQLL
jgi:hypothetical protein